jgi:hypothetical protein
VETLEVTRWLGCRNLRGYHCRGPRIEIPLVVAISDSSTDGNFNNHTSTGISDSSTDSNFNNHTGTGISDSSTDGDFNYHTGTDIRDSSSGGTSVYATTGSSDSSSYHNTSGRNAAAGDSCNSFDNFEHSSQPPAGGANCQIYGNSYNDCARRQCEAFLQIGECGTCFY